MSQALCWDIAVNVNRITALTEQTVYKVSQKLSE